MWRRWTHVTMDGYIYHREADQRTYLRYANNARCNKPFRPYMRVLIQNEGTVIHCRVKLKEGERIDERHEEVNLNLSVSDSQADGRMRSHPAKSHVLHPAAIRARNIIITSSYQVSRGQLCTAIAAIAAIARMSSYQLTCRFWFCCRSPSQCAERELRVQVGRCL